MIVFSSITRQFGDEVIAINDLSFTVDGGEMVLITGPSGSGKTTLMRLLIKQIDPSEGNISFNDKKLSELSPSEVPFHRRKIGVVFQDYKLLEELNIWENVALPLYIAGKSQAEIEERVTDVLKLVNMDDRAYAFPSQLSGGESQRIGIARALATAPKVLFADEPTGNLDSETTQTVVRLLQKINELGTTVLLATHDKNVLDLLDHIRRIELVKSKIKKQKEAPLDEDSDIEDKKEEKDEIKKEDEKEVSDSDEKKKNEDKGGDDGKKSKKNRKKKKKEKKVKKSRFKFKMPEIKLGDKNEESSQESEDEDNKQEGDNEINENE